MLQKIIIKNSIIKKITAPAEGGADSYSPPKYTFFRLFCAASKTLTVECEI